MAFYVKKLFASSACLFFLAISTSASGGNIVPEELDTWLTCSPKQDEPRHINDLYINYYDGLVYSDISMMGILSQIGPGNVIKDTEFVDETSRPPEHGGYILGGFKSGINAKSFRYRPSFGDLIAIDVTFSGMVIVEEPKVTQYDCAPADFPDAVRESMSYIRGEVITNYIEGYHSQHHPR